VRPAPPPHVPPGGAWPTRRPAVLARRNARLLSADGGHTRRFHAAGFYTLGFDTDAEVVASLAAGRSYLEHLPAADQVLFSLVRGEGRGVSD